MENKTINKIISIGVAILAITLIGVLMSKKTSPASFDGGLIAENGIHWHPLLSIYIKGERQLIPADIGVGPNYSKMPTYGEGGMAMTNIHTHEDTDRLHLEFPGRVTEENIKLKNFFTIWDKKFSPDCIFDYCNGAGGKMKMTVNGKENTEFGDYIMRDGDQIEIRYE